ncbi:MAG: 30S ribosomal protein S2 [Patescibacteria group bacterium]
MKELSLLEMLKSGVHFGHQKKRWHPKMAKFIHSIRGGVHIIDLEKTAEQLNLAGGFINRIVGSGQKILFVGTKRQAQAKMKQVAESTKMPYIVERWIGGVLTNFENISRLVKRLKDLRKKREAGELVKYTKREQVKFDEEITNLEKLIGGIQDMEKLPAALFIIDIKREKTALREAKKKNIPVIAIIDTNNNPDLVEYPIPANDDAAKSIDYILNFLTETISEASIKKDISQKDEEKKTQ